MPILPPQGTAHNRLCPPKGNPVPVGHLLNRVSLTRTAQPESLRSVHSNRCVEVADTCPPLNMAVQSAEFSRCSLPAKPTLCLLMRAPSGSHSIGVPSRPRRSCDRSAGPLLVLGSRARNARIAATAPSPPCYEVAADEQPWPARQPRCTRAANPPLLTITIAIGQQAGYFIGGYRWNVGNSCACSIQEIRSAIWMCTRAGTAAGSSYVALWISMMPGNTLSFL